MKTKSNLIILMIAIFGLIFAACNETSYEYEPIINTNSLEQTDELKKFSSSAEVSAFLKENLGTSTYGREGIQTFGDALAVAESADFAGGVVASKSSDDSGSASDYSQTNVQVEGVDEADFVKNDDKYIYKIAQNKLIIINAFPGSEAEVVSETKVEGIPSQMFVNKDRIVIFTTNFEDVYTIDEFDFVPEVRKEAQTVVYVYDVSDRTSPRLLKDYSVTGDYFQSRMIGDYVYFVAKENINYYGGPIHLPGVRQNGVLINNPEVYYFDNPEDNYVFHTVAAFNIFEDRQKFNAKTFMLGYSNNLYVSEDNIYISYRKNFPISYYQYVRVDMFFNVIVPLLPGNVRDSILEVETDLEVNSIEGYIEAWDKISLLLENMYNYMEEDDKKRLIEDIRETVAEYEARVEDERSISIIHKLSIERDEINYEGRGEVKGYLLNQFSLDEKDEYLRVATTTNYFTRESGSVQYSNVFVLDNELETIGKIEKIAPDERIYSTRFMGDKLYMVTFKQVDPLFTIDLSDPENPEIKGQLKIPGFSNYLHPYDENHIIGIGQDTVETEWGGFRTKGVKLSLFDVTDFDNPKELDVVIIGDSGSYTEVSNDHKALLFDKDKNLLVLPVREVAEKYEEDSNGYFRNKVWNGAYVFTITSNGFKERGKVSHIRDEDEKYYWNSPYVVRRALFMDDNLYTISDRKIFVNDLGTVDKIKEIDLPYDEDWNRWDYYYDDFDEGISVRTLEAVEPEISEVDLE